ncbi:MAG: hypothetical protein ACRDDX_10590 [Cellulosilyticaceae bacterium]
MALKISFKDFLAKYPFRFKARATPEEVNKFMSGIEANMEITPNFEVEQGTELNEAFFRQLESDINAEFVDHNNSEVAHPFLLNKIKNLQGEIDNIDVSWAGISGKPTTFPPSTHGHTVATTAADGFMSKGDKVKLDGVAVGANAYVHPGSGTNPHGTTKTDVGLGNVPNYQITAAVNDTSDSKFATAGAVKLAYDKGVEALNIANRGGVKSVQRGMSLANGKIIFNVTIAPVNTAKAVLHVETMLFCEGKTTGTQSMCGGRIVDGTTLEFYKSLSTSDWLVVWQVVEYY